jgi:hypothetical protein
MKRLLVTAAVVLMLAAVVVVMAEKPTGHRQGKDVGESSNTGSKGQCDADAKSCDMLTREN